MPSTNFTWSFLEYFVFFKLKSRIIRNDGNITKKKQQRRSLKYITSKLIMNKTLLNLSIYKHSQDFSIRTTRCRLLPRIEETVKENPSKIYQDQASKEWPINIYIRYYNSNSTRHAKTLVFLYVKTIKGSIVYKKTWSRTGNWKDDWFQKVIIYQFHHLSVPKRSH